MAVGRDEEYWQPSPDLTAQSCGNAGTIDPWQAYVEHDAAGSLKGQPHRERRAFPFDAVHAN
jgi:hypothetical protein